MDDMEVIFDKSKKSLVGAVKVLSMKDKKLANEVLHLEAEIDTLKIQIEKSHVERVNKGTCITRDAPNYLSIISHLERISDHAHNIVNTVIFNF